MLYIHELLATEMQRKRRDYLKQKILMKKKKYSHTTDVTVIWERELQVLLETVLFISPRELPEQVCGEKANWDTKRIRMNAKTSLNELIRKIDPTKQDLLHIKYLQAFIEKLEWEYRWVGCTTVTRKKTIPPSGVCSLSYEEMRKKLLGLIFWMSKRLPKDDVVNGPEDFIQDSEVFLYECYQKKYHKLTDEAFVAYFKCCLWRRYADIFATRTQLKKLRLTQLQRQTKKLKEQLLEGRDIQTLIVEYQLSNEDIEKIVEGIKTSEISI